MEMNICLPLLQECEKIKAKLLSEPESIKLTQARSLKQKQF